MSASPPKADVVGRNDDVRFVPKADILRCGKERRYSIASTGRLAEADNRQNVQVSKLAPPTLSISWIFSSILLREPGD
jgi:hypothetical protein